MANFPTHIAIGTVVSGALATVTLAADVVAPENLVAVTLAGVLGSVLPDIDLKDSRPSQALFAGLGVFFAFAVLFSLENKYSVVEMLVMWLGTLLAVGLMILPAASARLWTRELGPLIGLSVAFGLASALAGLVLSFHAELPSGPAIILAGGVSWLLSLLFGSTGGVLRRLWPPHHLEA